MIEWNDLTNYEDQDEDDAYEEDGHPFVPGVWETRVGVFRLVVHRYLGYPGVWFAACHPDLFRLHELDAKEIEAAQVEALDVLEGILRKALQVFDGVSDLHKQRTAFAFVHDDELHGIDLNSIGKSPEYVRAAMLDSIMGWRFKHPDRYDHDEAWRELLTFGRIVSVVISVTENEVDGE